MSFRGVRGSSFKTWCSSIRVVPRNGKLAADHLVQNDPQAVDVALSVHLADLAPGLLRRHVSRGAQHLTLDRDDDLAGFALGQAEVHQVRLAVVGRA